MPPHSTHLPHSRHEKEIAATEDFSKFRHILQTRVRTYDVDRQGLVHNAVYLQWMEAARVEYFRVLGLPIDNQTFVTKHRFVVARVEIDYIYAAQFDQEYKVYTRIVSVGNTSITFEQIARLIDGTILSKTRTVMVHLNPASHKPERVQDSYRLLIKDYEGDNVDMS